MIEKWLLMCCCGQALMHLMKHVGHFPMGSGAAQMSSVVTEQSDQLSDVTDDVARQKLVTADNVQVSCLSDVCLCYIHVRHIRLSTVGDRTFPVAAARTWNSLSQHVTSTPSMSVFWGRLKAFFFRRSFPWLTASFVVPAQWQLSFSDTLIVLFYFTYIVTYIHTYIHTYI